MQKAGRIRGKALRTHRFDGDRQLQSFVPPATDAVPVWFVCAENWPRVKASIGGPAAAFAERCGFKPKAGATAARCRARAERSLGVLFGVDAADAPSRDPLAAGKLATALPEGVYRFANPPADAGLAALGFLLGALPLRPLQGRRPGPAPARRARRVDAARIERIAAAVAFGRDLVNAPANVLGPEALEQAAVGLAEGFGASVRRHSRRRPDRRQLSRSFTRSGAPPREPPRIVDFAWGRESAPKVTLVGKGVTFDTGGLDIKPASGMELMKKDMGGAATALTLARLVMEAGLDLRLRVVDPDRRERHLRAARCGRAT